MGSHSVICHPNRAGWYSIYRPRKDERLSWPSRLVTYRNGLPVHRRSPIRVLTMRDFAHQKRVSFPVLGGFFQLATAKGPGRILTQNTPKHVVPPKHVPFWGREHKI